MISGLVWSFLVPRVKSKVGAETRPSSQNAGSCDGKGALREWLEVGVCQFTPWLVCLPQGAVPARAGGCSKRYCRWEGQKGA